MHNKIVVLAETPLQILCAYSTINSIENIFLFICGENRGGSRNLIKILFNNIKVHNIRNFFVLLKIVTKCVLHHGKINKLYIGDMRSIYNLLLIFIIRPNNIILLDDGYGSIVIDETRDISIHCNFVFIKSFCCF